MDWRGFSLSLFELQLYHLIMELQTTGNMEVTVTTYGGKKVQRIAVGELNDVVLICKKEEFEAAIREKRMPVTVGFKKHDVEVTTLHDPLRLMGSEPV